LAHVECRILAAEHKQKSSGGLGGWQTCSTCGQLFEGAMALGLGKELLCRVQGQPEFVHEWCDAAAILSSALINAGRYAEAEAVCRETMAALDRVGPNVPKLFLTQVRTVLANALLNQDKVAEAHVIFESCLAEYTELLGPDDMLTLDCARSLAIILSQQGKHAEAVAILRDIARRSSRTSGPENTATLDSMFRLANALRAQGKHDEALAIYVEHMPMMKRVFGPDHGLVLQGLVNHANSLACCGRLVEAEALLAETLPVITRVLGPEHPLSRHTVESIAMVRGLMNARN
jgi:tetratricopeptide (TPR) repeat protein